jgi:hypothetical protein
MILKDARAKAQRRKEIQMSKAQTFFAPLRLCASICLLSFAVGARAETTNDLSDAEIQGRKLAQQLCDTRPTEDFTNNGVFQVRDARGKSTNTPITFEAHMTAEVWITTYMVSSDSPSGVPHLGILHRSGKPNLYVNSVDQFDQNHKLSMPKTMIRMTNENAIMIPFANSDFWIADLGLEFFHWPEQKILKKEVKRSRGCSVLESTNLNPSTNGYSRVVSWIDNDGGGIVQAFAYDAQGKKLKEFYPKNIEKVNGQYQVQEMEMDNVQTGSRTRIEFDLNKQ